jgi:hypothetical protein
VGPRLGIDAPRRRLLDAVVSDRRGRRERFVDLVRPEFLAGQRVTPHAGETVGLQFQPDRQVVRPLGSCWTAAAPAR